MMYDVSNFLFRILHGKIPVDVTVFDEGMGTTRHSLICLWLPLWPNGGEIVTAYGCKAMFNVQLLFVRLLN